jgi:hypothetical protein
VNAEPVGQSGGLRKVQRDVHALENILTPWEMMRHAERAEAGNCRLLAELLRATPTVTFLQGQQRLEPFARRELSEGATLYTGRGPASGRSLMVGFCGKANRLMMPLPVFLQHLPAADWDVLVLKDARRTHFRRGVGGFAGNFPGLVGRVASLGAGYGRCVALGTSMGGLPAARFALLAGVERGISIGGRPPNDVLRLQGRSAPLDAFDPLCACLPSQERNLLFAYAVGCANDAEPAEAYAGLTGGRDLPVDGHANHGLLHDLHLRGALQDFLDIVLHQPVRSLGRSGQRRA